MWFSGKMTLGSIPVLWVAGGRNDNHFPTDNYPLLTWGSTNTNLLSLSVSSVMPFVDNQAFKSPRFNV